MTLHGSVHFNSHLEIQLGEIGVFTAATPVMGPPFAEPTLLIGMFYSAEPGADEDICAYSLVEIDQMMERGWYQWLQYKGWIRNFSKTVYSH